MSPKLRPSEMRYPMSQAIDPSVDLDRLDLNEIRGFLARRWRLVAATMVGCVVLAAIVCLAVTPIYTATSQILLDPRQQHVFDKDEIATDSTVDSSIVDSQIPIILSTRLLAKVVTKENLVDDPEFAAPAKPGLIERLFTLFRGTREGKVDEPSFDGIDPRLAPVILHLFDKTEVTRVAKSYVLSLAVSSRNPAKAMRLANSLAQIYVEDQIDVHARSVQQAADFFQDRLGRLRDQVRVSERAVADFRKEHNLTTVIMDGPITVGEQQLQDLNEKLATSSADTAEKLATYRQALRFKEEGASLDSLPQVIRSPVITALRTQQADLTRREADLAAMYGPAFPAITQIHAQRAGLDRAMQAEMRRLVATFKNDYEVAKAREASLSQTIGGLSTVSGGDNEVGVKLRELERTNLANKALFENFLNRAKLTQEQSTFEEPDARLISPALEPTVPSSPKTKIILAVSAVAGLLLGLGLAMIRDLLRAKSVGTPTARANAFILGRVPRIGGFRNARVDCAAYMDAHPGSAFARSIEMLTSKLVGVRGEAGGRVVTLASLSGREGATSVALCLAASAGGAGKRVLVIDADQARRGLSTALGLGGNPGFAEVIAGDLSAKLAVVAKPTFAVLAAGRQAFDASATVKQMRSFLAEARHRFDLVLIDAPAFDTGPDALALAAHADGLALVTCWEQLLREDFIAAVDAVADRPNFAGIILNRTAAEADEFALAS